MMCPAYYTSLLLVNFSLNVSFGEVADLLVELLGVESSNGKTEMRHLKCQHVRLSWLRDVYEQCCEDHLWEHVARAYLLHLVGCMIFANKSVTSINVSYLHSLEIFICVEIMHGELVVWLTYNTIK